MSDNLTVNSEVHVNPYENAVKEHRPAVGDIYIANSPSYNGFEVFRLSRRCERNGYPVWQFEMLLGKECLSQDSVSEESLRSYYRPVLGDAETVLKAGELIAAGELAPAKQLLGIGEGEAQVSESEALQRSDSKTYISTLLDVTEKKQNALEEAKLYAEAIIESKKYELEQRLREMDTVLKDMKEKVCNLVKIITVLNLYTGKTVDIHVITDGEPAEAAEPLSLRQRILYMDEELCAELDHEADYQDVPLFFESLKNPAFRDIIVPEPRCAVAVKPKRHGMEYRSGDAFYDAAREEWNRHTYVVLRNGEKLWWLESDDLEVWDFIFPHSDFEETFQKQMSDPRTSFKDDLVKRHDAVRYRTTKYMVFLQGLIDSQDLLGPFKCHPNLMKGEGVSLILDDEMLIGTGRLPWREFRKEKNRLIRRGTRILYDGGRTIHDGNKRWNAGGEHAKYYYYELSAPEAPGSGIYHADNYERVVRHDHGKAVTEAADFLVFRYLPGDTVWRRGMWGYDEVERRNKVAWKYNESHVLNYDAVTAEELQGYLSDRTLREDFRDMMPLLKRALLEKREEERLETAFCELVAAELRQETGRDVSPLLSEAVRWWKTKVIFSRPLSADDAKAFRMIKNHVKSQII